MKKIILTLMLCLVASLPANNLWALNYISSFPEPGVTTGIEGVPDGIPYAIQYGDFYSYSLPLLDYIADGGSGSFNANDEWYVGAPSPNDDVVVIYTKSSSVDEINPAGMDQAYIAEDSAQDNSSFYMTMENDPSYPNGNQPYSFAQEFSGDTEHYWDSTLSAMTSFLDGSDLFFFFNNNQKDSTDADSFPLQNLFGWGQVQLTDNEGLLPDLYFDFTNINTDNNVLNYSNDFGSAPLDAYQDTGSYDAYQAYFDSGNFVLSGGDYCIDEDGDNGTPIYPGPCDDGDDTVLAHNLGLNTAAYALNSPELDAFLQAWAAGSLLNGMDISGYDTFSLDMRLEYLNNGPEQLFIVGVGEEGYTPVPEPSALLLVGCGLVALVFTRRRKNS